MAFSISAVIASMGLMVSVVSILVGVKQFHGVVYIDHNFSSVLHAGGCEEAILVALGGQVADAEEVLDSFESIDIALAC